MTGTQAVRGGFAGTGNSGSRHGPSTTWRVSGRPSPGWSAKGGILRPVVALRVGMASPAGPPSERPGRGALEVGQRHLHGAGLLPAGPVLRLHPFLGGEDPLRGLLVADASQLG